MSSANQAKPWMKKETVRRRERQRQSNSEARRQTGRRRCNRESDRDGPRRAALGRTSCQSSGRSTRASPSLSRRPKRDAIYPASSSRRACCSASTRSSRSRILPRSARVMVKDSDANGVDADNAVGTGDAADDNAVGTGDAADDADARTAAADAGMDGGGLVVDLHAARVDGGTVAGGGRERGRSRCTTRPVAAADVINVGVIIIVVVDVDVDVDVDGDGATRSIMRTGAAGVADDDDDDDERRMGGTPAMSAATETTTTTTTETAQQTVVASLPCRACLPAATRWRGCGSAASWSSRSASWSARWRRLSSFR
jgi:hypothetical protein